MVRSRSNHQDWPWRGKNSEDCGLRIADLNILHFKNSQPLTIRNPQYSIDYGFYLQTIGRFDDSGIDHLFDCRRRPERIVDRFNDLRGHQNHRDHSFLRALDLYLLLIVDLT